MRDRPRKKPTPKDLERGDRIREARERIGLTQIGLADKLHVRPHTANRWELQGMLPKGENLSRLAKALNTTIEWMLHGNGQLEELPPKQGSDMPVRQQVTDHVEPDRVAELLSWARNSESTIAAEFLSLTDDVRRTIKDRILGDIYWRNGPPSFDEAVDRAIFDLTGRVIPTVTTAPDLGRDPLDGERILPRSMPSQKKIAR